MLSGFHVLAANPDWEDMSEFVWHVIAPSKPCMIVCSFVGATWCGWECLTRQCCVWWIAFRGTDAEWLGCRGTGLVWTTHDDLLSCDGHWINVLEGGSLQVRDRAEQIIGCLGLCAV